MPRRIAIVRPLLLASLLAGGFAVVWTALGNWGLEAVKDYVGAPEIYESLMLRMDGTPVIRKDVRPSTEKETYFTLDGKPLSVSRQEAWLSGAYLAGAKSVISFGLPWYHSNGWPGWPEFLPSYSDNGQPATYWYFLRNAEPPRSAYFVGFDSAHKQCVGYLGRHGFRAQKPSAADCFSVASVKGVRATPVSNNQSWQPDQEPRDPFYREGPGLFPRWLIYLATDEGVSEIDLAKRSTRLFFKQVGLVSAQYVSLGFPTPPKTDSKTPPWEYKQFLAVRTQESILVVDSQGKLTARFAIPAKYRDVTFEFHMVNNKSAVLELWPLTLRRVLVENTDAGRLLWIDTAGNIVRQQDFSLAGWWQSYTKPWFSGWHTSLMAPAPVAVAAASLALQPWIEVARGNEPAYLSAVEKSLADFWPALLVVCLASGLPAWLCYRRQKNYGLPWRKTWTTFVFLGGLPGLVGYYAHRRWPAMKPCPNCGRSIPCDRSACFWCNRKLPAPASKGTEVIA